MRSVNQSTKQSTIGSFTILLTATNFCFPKKHIPILFQSWGDSGILEAAAWYLLRATSKSPSCCIMNPAARIALGLVGSKVSAVPRHSNAFCGDPACKCSSPNVERRSGSSGLCLERKSRQLVSHSWSMSQTRCIKRVLTCGGCGQGGASAYSICIDPLTWPNQTECTYWRALIKTPMASSTAPLLRCTLPSWTKLTVWGHSSMAAVKKSMAYAHNTRTGSSAVRTWRDVIRHHTMRYD